MANLFSSGAPHIQLFPSFATILLVVWYAKASGDCSALPSKASSVNLLNDDTYQWNCVTVIVSFFGQIEKGVH